MRPCCMYHSGTPPVAGQTQRSLVHSSPGAATGKYLERKALPGAGLLQEYLWKEVVGGGIGLDCHSALPLPSSRGHNTHSTSIMYVRALRDAVARTLSNSDNETQSGGQGGGAHWEVCGGSGEFKKGRVGLL